MSCEVTGTIELQFEFSGTAREAAADFLQRHGSLPETIDGKHVSEICHKCGNVIFDGENFESDSDKHTCYVCITGPQTEPVSAASETEDPEPNLFADEEEELEALVDLEGSITESDIQEQEEVGHVSDTAAPFKLSLA